MFDCGPVLDKTPVMYWYFAGDMLGDKEIPLREGFYTVVADQRRGTVALTDANGNTVAHGKLEISIGPAITIEPSATRAAELKISASGSITKFDPDLKKKHIQVCGNASVQVGSASIAINGCIDVAW